MKVWRTFKLVLATLVVLALFGCGGGGDDSVDENQQIVLLSEVAVLESDPANYQIDANGTVTILVEDPAVAALKEGDIFVVADTAYKVSSITTVDGHTSIETTEPEFSEVFESVQIAVEVDVTTAHLDEETVAAGVFVGGDAGERISTQAIHIEDADGKITITLEDQVVYDLDRNPETTLDRVIANGTVELQKPKLFFEFNYGFFSKKYSELSFKCSESVNIQLSSQKIGFKEKYSLPLAKFIVPIAASGGTVNAAIEVALVFDASGEAKIATTVTQSFGVDVGIKAVLDPYQLTPHAEFGNPSFAVTEPKFEGVAKAKLAISPNIAVKLLQYNLAGLENQFGIAADAGVEVSIQEACAFLSANAFLNSSAYVLLPKLHLDQKFEWNKLVQMERHSQDLYAKDWIFYDSGMTCTVLPPGERPIIDLGGDGTGEAGSLFNDPQAENLYDVLKAGIDTSGGSLRLSERPSTFPFIWVANSGEGTISRLNTETGEELGRYRTGPNGSRDNPSRTTVDQNGNVWVGNRGNNTITKFGLPEAGQCVDFNGNGVIDTSRPTLGNPDVRAWEADECMLLHVALTWPGVATPSDIRLVAIDPNNNVFAGGYNRNSLFKVRGSDGVILQAVETNQGHYGGVVDREGNLWSMSSGSGKVEKISNDLGSAQLINLGHSGYGITIDKFGKVWTTEYGSRFSTFDPADPAGTLKVFTQTGSWSAQGIASDANGDIFIAGSLSGNSVGHYRNDGTFVANYTVGSGPTGVAVDAAGKVWAANYSSDSVSRIDPIRGEVVHFPIGSQPYNYSDMTGTVVRTVTTLQGTWNATFDSEMVDYDWKKVIWQLKEQGTLPDGTGVTVRIRAADLKTDLGALEYQEVSNGGALQGITGRYLQMDIKLFAEVEGVSEEITDLDIF